MSELKKSGQKILRDRPDLVSIVVPVYNEQESVERLTQAIGDALSGQAYELIFVDDGSDDETCERIARLAEDDPRICCVSLSRNFGHQYAIAAGLEFVRGDAAITMDGDMQHPPSLLPSFIEKWREGFNVVQGQRIDTKKVGLLKRTTSRMYYRLFSALCNIKLSPGSSDYRLLDRSILEKLKQLQEGSLFLRGLLAWMGFRQAVVSYEPGQRFAGRSKYTFRKMLSLAQAGVFSFSAAPLRISVFIGLIVSLLSLAELVYVVAMYFTGRTQPGWASTLAVMSLLFGALFLLLGLQGEYLYRIYQRVYQRPPFVVERVIDRRGTPDSGPIHEGRPDVDAQSPQSEHSTGDTPDGHA